MYERNEAAAGLSPGSGSFYRHFKDKAEPLNAVVDREIARATKDPAAQVGPDPAGPPAEALARQLRSDLDYLDDLEPLIAILLWERDDAPDLAAHVRRITSDRGIELGMAALARVTTNGRTTNDLEAAATVMQSAMIGYWLATRYFGVPPLDINADRFTSMLAHLLADDST